MPSKFTKANLGTIRQDFQEALEAFGKEHGFDIRLGNIRFSETEFKAGIEVKISGSQSNSDLILESKIKTLNLVSKNAQGDELVQYKPSNHKYPFIYVCGATGKRYKCNEQSVRLKFSV